MTNSDRAIEQLTIALADRYRIERELGAGGMATVFLATDLRHDRHVALKVLRAELAHALGPERSCARSILPPASTIRTGAPRLG